MKRDYVAVLRMVNTEWDQLFFFLIQIGSYLCLRLVPQRFT